jgi:hypothetical protein
MEIKETPVIRAPRGTEISLQRMDTGSSIKNADE